MEDVFLSKVTQCVTWSTIIKIYLPLVILSFYFEHCTRYKFFKKPVKYFGPYFLQRSVSIVFT